MLTVVCRLLYVRFSTFPISFVITPLFYIPHSSRLLRLLLPLLNYFRSNTYTWLCVCNLCLVQDSSKPDLWNKLSQDKCFKCMLWTKCFTMHCYFAVGSTVKYCDDVSVCLSVCLSARKNIFRTTRPIFFVHVTCGHGLVLHLTALRYDMYFRFHVWHHICTQWDICTGCRCNSRTASEPGVAACACCNTCWGYGFLLAVGVFVYYIRLYSPFT